MLARSSITEVIDILEFFLFIPRRPLKEAIGTGYEYRPSKEAIEGDHWWRLTREHVTAVVPYVYPLAMHLESAACTTALATIIIITAIITVAVMFLKGVP